MESFGHSVKLRSGTALRALIRGQQVFGAGPGPPAGVRRAELQGGGLRRWGPRTQPDGQGCRGAVAESHGLHHHWAVAESRRLGVGRAGVGQSRWHPAGIRVAQDETLLSAVVRRLLHGRLDVYLCRCWGGDRRHGLDGRRVQNPYVSTSETASIFTSAPRFAKKQSAEKQEEPGVGA